MEPISDVEFATDSHILADENEEGLIKIEAICKDQGKRAHCVVLVNGDQFGNLVTDSWRIVIVPKFERIGHENGLPVLLAKELRGFVKHIDPDERFFV